MKIGESVFVSWGLVHNCGFDTRAKDRNCLLLKIARA